jgi:hypothetical protein
LPRKEWRDANLEKARAYKRKERLSLKGMTFEDFEKLKVDQDHRCAVCKRVTEVFHIDHDHSCCPGQKTCGNCNRGLLCSNCNLALGLLGDSISTLDSAIDYLAAHGEMRLG